MGDLFFCHSSDKGRGIELAVEDEGSTEEHGGHEGNEGTVEHDGSRVDNDALRCHAKCRCTQATIIGPDLVGVDDPLWLSSGSAAVDDVEKVIAVNVDTLRVLVVACMACFCAVGAMCSSELVLPSTAPDFRTRAVFIAPRASSGVTSQPRLAHVRTLALLLLRLREKVLSPPLSAQLLEML